MKRILPLLLLAALAATGCGDAGSGNDPKADTSKAPPGLKPAGVGGTPRPGTGTNEAPKGNLAP